ncbi:MAG TPA: FtsQ-type POTRA domain-containing protein [Candidatus Dormibacteraeota bacterium]|nr:FtsQ-type POTRA domain-containing protein [Candidatus Dormibacteraeota bacterium]
MTVGTLEKRRRASAESKASAARGGRGWFWAILQLALIGVEAFALLFLLAQPAFLPRQVRVSGISHLREGEVRQALALPHDRNIFFLSAGGLERRVEALPWVRSAAISVALPGQVTVRVSEWQPNAVLQVGEGTYYVNDRGVILDPAPEARGLTVIDRPDFGNVHDGDRAITPELLSMLRQMQAAFTGAFKISISAFELDQRDVMTAHTDRGWEIIFGQMTTREQRASLEPKLAALRALETRLDLISAPIDYINLMNPGAPAVQMLARAR